MDFARGRLREARSHYRRADAAYPGYWLVEEHIAELLGAEGRYEEATGIFERIVSAIERPDFEQAIGELYDLAGRGRPAVYWKERALSAYLQSAQRARSIIITTSLITIRTLQKRVAKLLNGHIKTCN